MKVLRILKTAILVSSIVASIGACGRQMIGMDGYYRDGYGLNGASCNIDAQPGGNVYVGEIVSSPMGTGRVVLTVMGGGMHGQFSASAAIEVGSMRMCCNSHGQTFRLYEDVYFQHKALMRGVQFTCHSMPGTGGFDLYSNQRGTLTIGVAGAGIGYSQGFAALTHENRVKGYINLNYTMQMMGQVPLFVQ